MKTNQNKRSKERGFMDPISLGFIGALIVFHAVCVIVTQPDLTTGTRPGEPLPTLPTMP